MKKSFFYLNMLVLLMFPSCGFNLLSFGPDEETGHPSQSQVERCVAEMYISDQIKFEPMGYKLIGSGIDDIIWFKFRTSEKNISRYFIKEIVDTKDFFDNFELEDCDTEWWDADSRQLKGGGIELPNARYMSVGIAETAEYNIVYVVWFET